MSYQSDRLHGLGISNGSPMAQQPYNSSPASSPQRQQQWTNTGTGSPQRSPVRSSAPSRAPTTPTRLQIHQPSNSAASPVAQPQFALRPTHSTRGYSLPPPAPPPFAPATSSPLKPRADNSAAYGQMRQYAEPAFEEYENSPKRTTPSRPTSKESGSSSHSRQVRQSKSTEMLKRLSCSQTNSQRSTYQEFSDDEDDDPDERLRLPTNYRNSPRSSVGAASGLPDGSPASSNQTRGSVRSGSNVPGSPPSSSSDTFHSANEDQGPLVQPGYSSSSDSGAQHRGSPTRSRPHAAQAAPSRKQRPKSEMILMRKHSQNEALLAAETGGMVQLHGDLFSTANNGIMGPAPNVRSPVNVAPGSHEFPNGANVTNRMSMQSTPSSSEQHSSSGFGGSSYSHTGSSGFSHNAAELVRNHNNNSGFDFPQQLSASSSLASGASGGTRHKRSYSDGEGLAALARQGTLLHPASSEARAAMELDLMLGKPRSRRLSGSRLLPAPEGDKKSKDKVRLEASKKSRARVELDVVIERECVVEGGELRGRLEIVVRGGKKNKDLRVGAGKIRVLGFEELPGNASNSRHIFYQHQYPLPAFQESRNVGPSMSLFADAPDEEGFCLAREGTHAVPFACPLPIGGGAKGSYTSPTAKGPNIRYVVVGSVKLHIPKTGKRAIAHFYRPVVILPYFSPSAVLIPSPAPIVAHHQSGLGWSIGGEKGKVTMQVALGRRTWVAGQRAWCEVTVRNESKKKINKCALAILQTVNTYGLPGKGRNPHVPIEVERKKVSEEMIEADFMEIGSGHITGKSWWTGLEPNEANRWDMSVPIPGGMISIPRSRFVEVTYTLRVTLNNTIYVDIPLNLINFLSIDPPPMPSDIRRRARLLQRAPAPPPMQPVQMGGPVDPRYRAVAMAGVAMRDESPTLGNQSRDISPRNTVAQGYTSQQLRGDEDNMARARTSSTTLNIDTLMEQGRARAAQPDPQDTMEELNPRAPSSPASAYSTEHGKGTLRSRHELEHQHDHGHDESGCQLCVDEAQRREGRANMLEVIRDEGDDDKLSMVSHDSMLTMEDRKSYVPNEAPVEKRSFEIGRSGPNSETTHEDDDMDDDDAATETDRTPQGSPQLSPENFQLPMLPQVHPREAYLSHISEEEEPFEDETLDDIISNGHEGGHFEMQGDGDEDDLYDEPHYQGSDGPKTPQDTPGRRSLEDRLSIACHTGLRPPPRRSPERPKSVDYTEPIDLDQMSLHGLSLHDHHDDGYDGDSNSTLGRSSSPTKRTKPRHSHSNSLPAWPTDLNPPMLPSLASVRNIPWGGDLTGRTVSGRSMMPVFDDEPQTPRSPFEPRSLRMPSPVRRTPSPVKSPSKSRSASPLKRPSSPAMLKHGRESRNLAALAAERPLTRDNETFDLMSKAAESSDEELAPPNRLTTGPASSSNGSYHTAHSGSSHERLPPLQPSHSDSGSSEGLIESPTNSRKPAVYERPLPNSPSGLPQRASLDVPDRFRPVIPRERVVSDESFASHTSMSTNMSSTQESAVLPAVKARVAQIETREDALRRFTVGHSVGLSAPSPVNGTGTGSRPLSPVSTGSTAQPSSKRKSYTAALAPRPASLYSREDGSSPRSAKFSVSSRSSGDRFSNFSSSDDGRSGDERSEYSERTLDDLRTPPHSTYPTYPQKLGLAPEALSGSAFAHGPGSPTSTISHAHHTLASGWEAIGDVGSVRSASPDKQSRLLRNLSTTSVSTTATEIERALSGDARSPSLMTPRGPRALGRAPSPLPSPTKLNTPSYTASPAHTPRKAPSPAPNHFIRSETATVDHAYLTDGQDAQSEGMSETMSEVGSGSDFGSTGYAGNSVRLPPVRAVGPRPM